ncbi:MAG: hypothetical protein RMY29_022570 [Nostoc sp. CreGUA01]|nr:hypothetical protein [Nostoc sp. CreGUA01]
MGHEGDEGEALTRRDEKMRECGECGECGGKDFFLIVPHRTHFLFAPCPVWPMPCLANAQCPMPFP